MEPNSDVSIQGDVSSLIVQRPVTTTFDLDIENGIAYLPNDYKPYTGTYTKAHPVEKKIQILDVSTNESVTTEAEKKIYMEISYKDGKKDGPSIMWDENGRKIGQLNYKDGKRIE